MFRFVGKAVVAVILVLSFVAQAGPHSHPLDEDSALALLERTLKHDGVYTHRISLDCVGYGTEETTDAYFQFVPPRKPQRQVRRRSRNESSNRSLPGVSAVWQN